MRRAVIQAENETRTHDPFITSEVLYRLSYSSLLCQQLILYLKMKYL